MATEKLIAYHDNGKGDFAPAYCDRIREIAWRVSFLLGAASRYMDNGDGLLPTDEELSGMIFLSQDIQEKLYAFADDLAKADREEKGGRA